MPITTRVHTTPGGHSVLEARFDGDVTVPDARAYHRSILPGGPFEHHGHLITGDIRALSSDVKEVLGSRGADPANPHPVAVVVDSELGRLSAQVLLRASGNTNAAAFTTVEDALRWLDGRLAEYHRRRAAPAP